MLTAHIKRTRGSMGIPLAQGKVGFGIDSEMLALV
jgi:hypothetical protein